MLNLSLKLLLKRRFRSYQSNWVTSWNRYKLNLPVEATSGLAQTVESTVDAASELADEVESAVELLLNLLMKLNLQLEILLNFADEVESTVRLLLNCDDVSQRLRLLLGFADDDWINGYDGAELLMTLNLQLMVLLNLQMTLNPRSEISRYRLLMTRWIYSWSCWSFRICAWSLNKHPLTIWIIVVIAIIF